MKVSAIKVCTKAEIERSPGHKSIFSLKHSTKWILKGKFWTVQGEFGKILMSYGEKCSF